MSVVYCIQVKAYVDKNKCSINDLINYKIELQDANSFGDVKMEQISKDFSVIELLFTSLSEKAEPLNDATRSSFWLFIDKKTGNIKNRKITRHPLIIEIEVFIFIVDI